MNFQQKKMVRVLSCDVLDHLHPGDVSAYVSDDVLLSRFRNLSLHYNPVGASKRQRVIQQNTPSSTPDDANETEDFVLRALAPDGCTVTSSLVLAASKIRKFRSDFEKAKQEAKHFGKKQHYDKKAMMNDMWDRFAVKLGVKMLEKLSAEQTVSVEIHPELAADVDASLARANQILYLYAIHGIPKERVLLRFASSWESVQACKTLRAEGVKCTFMGHSNISSNREPSAANDTDIVTEKVEDEIKVSAEVDASLGSDIEGSLAKAREMLHAFAAEGIDKKHVLLKFVSSWESVHVCKVLKAEGANCTYVGHSQSFKEDDDMTD